MPALVGATPVALFLREHEDAWLTLASAGNGMEAATLDAAARRVLEHLQSRGASFSHELAAATAAKRDDLCHAIADLVASGLVTSDGFAGLRTLIGGAAAMPARKAPYGPLDGRRYGTPAARHAAPREAEAAGRWSTPRADCTMTRETAVETYAWTLLRRYGVVFRRLPAREGSTVTWRELTRVYRILEARGDIRGGRFVSGMSGEQFALPEAVDRLREIRRGGNDERLITISAADPLNLTGIVTPGDRIRASAGNRIVYRNGIPVAAMEGDMLRTLSELEPSVAADAAAAAAGRRVPVIAGYVGRLG